MIQATLLAVLTAALLATPQTGKEAPVKISAEVGKAAPDFTLRDQEGKEVKLSSLKGKQGVLLAFYPKDFTGGCTAEMKGFRDEHAVFVKAGVKVLGISVDGVESHKKFCGELQLPFSLLSDSDGKISELYGIQSTTPAGELLSGRSVFLVDRAGVLRFADPKYDLKSPADHDALLKAVGALKTPFAQPRVTALSFGQITVDGKERTNDVIFDRGKIRERDKGPSKDLKAKYGHTPLSASEEIPWECKTLLIGIGMDGQLPVLDDVKEEAKRRGVKLILLKTPEAVEHLKKHADDEELNAVLHITC